MSNKVLIIKCHNRKLLRFRYKWNGRRTCELEITPIIYYWNTLWQRLDRKSRLARWDRNESLTLKVQQMLLLLKLLHLEELLLEDKLLGCQLLLLLQREKGKGGNAAKSKECSEG